MIAHLLGNGPSRSQFPAKSEGDIFGCNLSDFSLPLKATFIMDKVVIDHIHNNRVMLPFPLICPQSLAKIVRQCPTSPTIYDVIPRNLLNGESTGHRAFEYLVDQGYTEIHLWGFDSINVNTIASDSHQKIPSGIFFPGNLPKWRSTWNKLFSHPKVRSKVKVEVHFLPGPGSSVE